MKIVVRHYDINNFRVPPALNKTIITRNSVGEIQEGTVIPKGTTITDYMRMKQGLNPVNSQANGESK